MKALKEFDYNLWTTEENGVKKYFVGVKATGEVTEVDLSVYLNCLPLHEAELPQTRRTRLGEMGRQIRDR